MTLEIIKELIFLPPLPAPDATLHNIFPTEISSTVLGKDTKDKEKPDFEEFWKGVYQPLLEEIITHIPKHRNKSEIYKQVQDFYREFFFEPPKELREASDFGKLYDEYLKSFSEFSQVAQKFDEIYPEITAAYKRLLQNKAELLKLSRDNVPQAATKSDLPYNFFRVFSLSLRVELSVLEKEIQAKEDSILYREALGKSLAKLNWVRESIGLYLLLCSVDRLSWDELSKIEDLDVEALDMEYFNTKLSELEDITERALEEAIQTGYYIKPEFQPEESFIHAFSSALISED